MAYNKHTFEPGEILAASQLNTLFPQICDASSTYGDLNIKDDNENILLSIKNGDILTKNFNSQNAINIKNDNTLSELNIADPSGNIMVEIKNGYVKTSNFNSREAISIKNDLTSADLNITDINGNIIAEFKEGHIKTKNFDSRTGGGGGGIINPYAGKKCSILGDSISTYGVPDSRNEQGTYCYSYYPTQTCRYSLLGNVTEEGTTYQSIQFDVNDTWWMRVINELDMTLGINESWRGTKVSGTGSSAFNNQNRINHLGLNGTPDLILVYGGTNDAGANVSIGTFNTENPQNYTDAQISSLPVSTFADAYRAMLIRLQKKYQTSEIVVILPTFTTSYYTITSLDQYVEVIKEECDFFGIKYIDIRTAGMTCFNRGSYLSDGIHPNAAGMKLLADKIKKLLLYT